MANSKGFMGAICLAGLQACGGPSHAAQLVCLPVGMLTCLLRPARLALHVMHAVVRQPTWLVRKQDFKLLYYLQRSRWIQECHV